MRGIARLIMASLLVCACDTNGVDLTGSDLDGVDTVGTRGGLVESIDGRLTVELGRQSPGGELDVSVGSIDDCPGNALACYELEPKNAQLENAATITFETLGNDAESTPDNLVDIPLIVYARCKAEWVRLPDWAFDASPGVVRLSIDQLCPVAFVPKHEPPI